jgi:hypothetical protein
MQALLTEIDIYPIWQVMQEVELIHVEQGRLHGEHIAEVNCRLG